MAQPKTDPAAESLKTQTYGPSGSLRGLPAPMVPVPNRIAPPNQQTQDMMDRKKDWIFRDPESLLESPRRQDGMGADASKKDTEKLSPMEQFYLKFITPAARKDEPAKDSDKREDKDAFLPPGLRASETYLQELTQQARQSSLSGAKLESSDYLGRNGNGIGFPELTPAQKFRQEAFRQMVQESFIANPLAGMGADRGLTPPTAAESTTVRPDSFSTPLDSKLSSSSFLRAPETQLGVVPAMPSLLDVNTKAMMPQTPLQMSPGMLQQGPLAKPQGPPSSTPARPTFSAPRRSF